MDFNDACILIFGGSSGIGLATAMRFGDAGAHVAIAGRDRRRGKQAIDVLKDKDIDGLYLTVDVQDTASVNAAVDAVVKRWGRLDFAFNNAGWEGVPGPLEESSESDWLRMIDIKLNGVWRCMRAELIAMRVQSRGAIVNMAGSWGLVGFPNYAAYCAAAHGIVGLTRAGALEVANAGIRINAVCPGAVDAPMLDRMVGHNDGAKQEFGEALAVGRLCRPEEVANAVAWLCADDSSYINGVALPIDGGS